MLADKELFRRAYSVKSTHAQKHRRHYMTFEMKQNFCEMSVTFCVWMNFLVKWKKLWLLFFLKHGGMGNVRPVNLPDIFWSPVKAARESYLPSVSRGLPVVQCPRVQRWQLDIEDVEFFFSDAQMKNTPTSKIPSCFFCKKSLLQVCLGQSEFEWIFTSSGSQDLSKV